MLLVFGLGVCLLAPGRAGAQQPPRSAEELTWDVRQLQASRAQCEEHVSALGVQLERVQQELAAVQAQRTQRKAPPAQPREERQPGGRAPEEP